MEKILSYRCDHNQKLIYETVRGKVNFSEFIEFEKRKLNDPEHDYSYSVFADIRDAVFDFSDEEKEILYKMYKELASKMNIERKCAFLTSSPEDVVTSELFIMRIEQLLPMRFKVFSTEESAYRWLGVI